MKRPLLIIIAGQISGILWGLYFKMNIVPILLCISIALAILRNRIKYKNYIVIFLITTFISNMQITYLENKHENLYANLEQMEVIGVVDSDVEYTRYKARYTIKVHSINGSKEFKNTKLITYVNKEPKLEYGKIIKFKATYEQPTGPTNYKEFDYRSYLKTQNIYGTAYTEGDVQISNKTGLNLLYIISNKVKGKIERKLRLCSRRKFKYNKTEYYLEIQDIYQMK